MNYQKFNKASHDQKGIEQLYASLSSDSHSVLSDIIPYRLEIGLREE